MLKILKLTFLVAKHYLTAIFSFNFTHIETDVNKLNDDADENEPPRKRALWSDNTSGPREWRERHMFPNECFICHSVKMKPYKFTGKRLVVRLMRCEIVNGGKDIRIVYPVGCSTGPSGHETHEMDIKLKDAFRRDSKGT